MTVVGAEHGRHAANPVASPAGGLAAEIEMIRSAMVRDFRPTAAARKIGIRRDFASRGRDEPGIALHGLRAELLVRPGQDATAGRDEGGGR